MIHGLDTGFLVAAALLEHADNATAQSTPGRLIAAGLHLAEQWWTASEVVQVFPDVAATRLFLAWLQQFSLGRKRLLDTLLAATYRQNGISSILTTNPGRQTRGRGNAC